MGKRRVRSESIEPDESGLEPGKRRKGDLLTEEDVNAVISNLALPDPNTLVAVNYSNATSNTEVQAYAKLAGSSWTYYVQKLKVVIGRSSEPVYGPQGIPVVPQSDEHIDIDLGPAKVVSRRHAYVQYNLDSRTWELTVTGRNGVRIDKVSHKEGTIPLNSGNILDIGGVQMMFVLPDVAPRVSAGMLNPATSRHRKTASMSSVGSMHSPPSRPSAGLAAIGTPNGNGTPLANDGSEFHENGNGNGYFSTIPQGNSVNPATSATAPLAADQEPSQAQTQQQQQHQQQQQQQQQHQQQAPQNSAPQASNLYPKGVAIITRPQVRGVAGGQYMDQDLSSDDAKDIKPPYSYATMIAQAIMSTEEMMMSLADIYEWIARNYSFYRHSKSGWQNSIRHNLSLNKAFEKVPRPADKPGKGMKWQITPQFKEEFIRKANLGKLAKKSSRKGGNFTFVANPNGVAPAPAPVQQQLAPPPGSSNITISNGNSGAPGNPGSPINPTGSDVNANANANSNSGTTSNGPSHTTVEPFETPQRGKGPLPRTGYIEAFDQGNFEPGLNNGAGSLTPSPPKRYPVSQLEAYTPERGSNFTNNGGNTNSTSKRLPTPNFSSIIGSTPAPQASHLQLAPPSSAQQQQLPSSFMPTTSPAPFWKYMQLSSTPVRLGADFSPTKMSSPLVENNQSTNGTPAKGKEESLGDLQDVDLTRGFRQIGKWRQEDEKVN